MSTEVFKNWMMNLLARACHRGNRDGEIGKSLPSLADGGLRSLGAEGRQTTKRIITFGGTRISPPLEIRQKPSPLAAGRGLER